MFDAEVIMPVPGNVFVEGKANAVEALRATLTTGARAWSGFLFGQASPPTDSKGSRSAT